MIQDSAADGHPAEIDYEVAGLKLESLGVSIDSLSEEQRAYLEDTDK